jgi:hypothetical protein
MRLRKLSAVLVTYPGGRIYHGKTLIESVPDKEVVMTYHGKTVGGTKSCIVEDANGWVHVVSPSIVKPL